MPEGQLNTRAHSYTRERKRGLESNPKLERKFRVTRLSIATASSFPRILSLRDEDVLPQSPAFQPRTVNFRPRANLRAFQRDRWLFQFAYMYGRGSRLVILGWQRLEHYFSESISR